jgi:hypothetical protein
MTVIILPGGAWRDSAKKNKYAGNSISTVPRDTIMANRPRERISNPGLESPHSADLTHRGAARAVDLPTGGEIKYTYFRVCGPGRSGLIVILNDILFVLDLFFSALDNQFRFGYLFVFKLKMDVV